MDAKKKSDAQRDPEELFLKEEWKAPEDGGLLRMNGGGRLPGDRGWRRETREPAAVVNFSLFQKEGPFKMIFQKVVLKRSFLAKTSFKVGWSSTFSQNVLVFVFVFFFIFLHFRIKV